MKRWLSSFFGFALFALLLTAGCFNPQRDMARFMMPPKEEQPAYRAVAMEFVRLAQAGDVERMLQMTSTRTYAKDTDSMRSLYAKEVVPEFAGQTVTWHRQMIPSVDEEKKLGLVVTGTARGPKTFVFDVIVQKEEGKLVVINIRKQR